MLLCGSLAGLEVLVCVHKAQAQLGLRYTSCSLS